MVASEKPVASRGLVHLMLEFETRLWAEPSIYVFKYFDTRVHAYATSKIKSQTPQSQPVRVGL